MSFQRDRWFALGMLLLPALTLYAQGEGLEHVFDADRIVSYFVATLLISVFILIFYNFVYRFREQDANLKNQRQNSRLALVLQTGHLRLWLYDVHTRHYIMLSETGEYIKEYDPIEFAEFFDRNDF